MKNVVAKNSFRAATIRKHVDPITVATNNKKSECIFNQWFCSKTFCEIHVELNKTINFYTQWPHSRLQFQRDTQARHMLFCGKTE